MNVLRFAVFNLVAWCFVVTHGTTLLLVAPFGHRYAFAVARNWCRLISRLVRVICGLTYRIEGKANFPAEPSVIFIKHSSAFETYLQLAEFPRSAWVLKKELLYIPFFGWALRALQSIAIDRSAGNAAVRQVITQGTERLRDGIWVSIFPEGTRMAPGTTRRYGISGTLLAQEAGCRIVPVAHDAGYHWPRNAKAIKPGEIVLVVGEPVDPAGRDAREVNEEIQAWMESTVARIVADKQR